MSKVLVASHNNKKIKLEQALSEFNYPLPIVIRMGGIMDYDKYPIQINTVEGTLNCIDKLISKSILREAGLPTLDFFTDPTEFPFVMKGRTRSRGSSVFMVDNIEEFNAYKKILKSGFYVEPYFKYTSEYRLHCTDKEVFFAVKKRKNQGSEGDLFITADNHLNTTGFVKPRLWKEIKKISIEAVKAHGLDIACVDIGYDSKTSPHSFVIHELNTSPELRNNTFGAYVEALNKIIESKL